MVIIFVISQEKESSERVNVDLTEALVAQRKSLHAESCLHENTNANQIYV